MYMPIIISQFLSPLFPHFLSRRPFSTSAGPANWAICTIFLDALIYNICFSLSDLLHSLGPSTPLQMTQFHSFSWLSTLLYICAHLLYLYGITDSIDIEFEQAPGAGDGTGKPGMLQSMGSQWVGDDWATELNFFNHSSVDGHLSCFLFSGYSF